jgi:toxin CptA
MQLPATLSLRPSPRLDILLLAAHGAALAVLSAISIPDLIRALLLLLICCSAGLAWQRAHGRGRIVSLLLRADGKLEYARLNGESGEAQPHPHTTVTPQLTLLLLRLGKRLEALALLPDSLPAEEFRQLRLWLRWQAAANEQVGS